MESCKETRGRDAGGDSVFHPRPLRFRLHSFPLPTALLHFIIREFGIRKNMGKIGNSANVLQFHAWTNNELQGHRRCLPKTRLLEFFCVTDEFVEESAHRTAEKTSGRKSRRRVQNTETAKTGSPIAGLWRYLYVAIPTCFQELQVLLYALCQRPSRIMLS